MHPIVWTEDFSVGVPKMDDHHRQLAALINRLADHREAPSDAAAIDGILAALMDYAAMHFRAEEALIVHAGFPDWEAHQAEHQQFCEAMREIRYGATLGIVDLERLYGYLTRWWTHHILQEDRKYTRYLKVKAA